MHRVAHEITVSTPEIPNSLIISGGRSQHLVVLLADWMSAVSLQAVFYGKSQSGVQEKVTTKYDQVSLKASALACLRLDGRDLCRASATTTGSGDRYPDRVTQHNHILVGRFDVLILAYSSCFQRASTRKSFVSVTGRAVIFVVEDIYLMIYGV